MGFASTQALHAAVMLGVADALAAGPRPAAELAGELSVQPGALRRLLRALGAQGVFAEAPPGSGVFRNNRGSSLLRRDHPCSLADAVLLWGGPCYAAHAGLAAALAPGAPPAWHAFSGGLPFYDWLGRPENEAAAGQMDRLMAGADALLTRVLLQVGRGWLAGWWVCVQGCPLPSSLCRQPATLPSVSCPLPTPRSAGLPLAAPRRRQPVRRGRRQRALPGRPAGAAAQHAGRGAGQVRRQGSQLVCGTQQGWAALDLGCTPPPSKFFPAAPGPKWWQLHKAGGPSSLRPSPAGRSWCPGTSLRQCRPPTCEWGRPEHGNRATVGVADHSVPEAPQQLPFSPAIRPQPLPAPRPARLSRCRLPPHPGLYPPGAGGGRHQGQQWQQQQRPAADC